MQNIALFLFLLLRIKEDKSIKKIIKIGGILLLALIALPTLSMLFLQNQQIQTKISEYYVDKFSDRLNAEISFSAIHYSFFKRLNIYDLYIKDQEGDTLIYSELSKIRIKHFRPDKKIVHLKKLSIENGYVQIKMDENKNNSMRFLIDSMKRDLPPEEKMVIKSDEIEFIDSRFRRINESATPAARGIDFSDLNLLDLNFTINDFLFNRDTSYLNVHISQAHEPGGFNIEDMVFDLSFSPKHMTFLNNELITDESHFRIPVVDLHYDDPQDLKFNIDSVNLHIISANSEIAFSDLEQFFYQLNPIAANIQFDGELYGRFGDLHGKNIHISAKDHTYFNFDMNILGLTEEDSPKMEFNFYELSSNLEELNSFIKNKDFEFLSDSARNASLGELSYKGSFKGYLTDFEMEGELSSQLGNIGLSLNMQPDSSRKLVFNGNIKSDQFQIGSLVADQGLENVSFNLDLAGINDRGKIHSKTSGKINSLKFKGYNYSNIDIQGEFSNRRYDGLLKIQDPNIDLEFIGHLDFEKQIPEYKFTLDVSNLRPYYLNLRHDDPEYFASFFLKTSMAGNSINNINGSVQLINSLFRSSESQIQLYDAQLITSNSDDSSSIALKSEMINAELSGNFKLTNLPYLFSGIINDHFNIISLKSVHPDPGTNMDLKIDLINVNQLLDFFYPDISISENTIFRGLYNSTDSGYNFQFNGDIPVLAYKTIEAKNSSISISSDENEVNTLLFADQLINESGLSTKNNTCSVIFKNNQSLLDVFWDNNRTPSYRGSFKARGKLNTKFGKPEFTMRMIPSKFIYKDQEFLIPSSNIMLSEEKIAVDSFIIKGESQSLLVDGSYSNSNDTLIFNLSEINLGLLNELTNKIPVKFAGNLTGKAKLWKEPKSPMITSSLRAKNLQLNEEYIGSTKINANWDQYLDALNVQISSENIESNHLDINGSIVPESGKINFDLNVNRLNLKGLSPYFKKQFDNLNGVASMNGKLDGTIENPYLNGSLVIENGEFKLNSTQTTYFINDTISISNNDILFKDFILKDIYDKSLSASGNIATSNFSSLYINIDLEANEFNFLNTTRNDNPKFYGEIFGSALAEINGTPDQLNIKVSASTSKGTNLKLPLYNPTNIQTTDFITFINKNDIVISRPAKKTENKNSLTLDMDLNVTSNTNVQLIFDPKVGDIIDMSGYGPLKLEIDENGVFSMYGDVYVQDGQYLLTLQNVINKRFRVKPGGTISWNGSPLSANLALDAVYETKASTYSLSPAPTDNMKKRIPVNCLLSLQGELSNLTITPGIELPTSEPETRSLVETNIGTEEDLMRQFFSLLVINNFVSPSDLGLSPGTGAGSAGVAGVTASELLSNQLSNWLSQLSTDFDIGVNYRPGDAISSDEVEVALSTQLLNDRIIFSGNLDVVGDAVSTRPGEASNIVGDFDLEFMVSEKVSLKAFNRVNDDRVIRPSLYTQGVGIQYRNEFNIFGELFRRKKKTGSSEKSKSNPRNNVLPPEENRTPDTIDQ